VEASEVVVLVMQKAADQPVEYLKITMDVPDVLRLCSRAEDRSCRLISDMPTAAVIVEHVVSQAIRLLGAVSGRAEWSLP
jgi:hypothetical protein